MAITCSGVGSGLKRNGAYLADLMTASQSWSVGFWWKAPTIPTTSKYCLYLIGDVNKIHPYWAVYYDSTGFYTEVFNGTIITKSNPPLTTYSVNRWVWISLSNISNFTFYLNNRQVSTNSTSANGLVFVEKDEYIGTDGSSLGGASLAYIHTYSVWSSGQFNTNGRVIAKFLDIDYYTMPQSSVLSECRLLNAASLDDYRGAHPLTALGSIVSEPNGPLDLINGIFLDDFNSGELIDKWTEVKNISAIGGNIGCGNSGMFARCWGSGQIWKGFGAQQYTEGSLRCMIFPYMSTSPGGVSQMFTVLTQGGDSFSPGAGAVQYVVNYSNTGIQVRYIIDLTPTAGFLDSAPNLIIPDGRAYGFQMLFKVHGSFQDVTVYLDDVKVIEGLNLPLAAGRQYWTDVSINVDSSNTNNVGYDNFEVTNQAVFKSWKACTLNKVQNCSQIIVTPPPPDMSGIYVINPNITHDIYYTAEKKIPDPTIRTAKLGE